MVRRLQGNPRLPAERRIWRQISSILVGFSATASASMAGTSRGAAPPARTGRSPTCMSTWPRRPERACFDFVLLEDSVFVPDNYGSSMDFYLKRALRAPKNDPLPLVPLMAQATSRLGLVPTISTSFYPPYLLARLIATLDLMSKGRVGCNFVTSTAERAAQNFGLDEPSRARPALRDGRRVRRGRPRSCGRRGTPTRS